MYAARGGNFAKPCSNSPPDRDALTIIDDQHGAPTGAELLADVTAHAARMTLANPDLAGTYHLPPAARPPGTATPATSSNSPAPAVWRSKSPRRHPPVPTSAFPDPAQAPGQRLDTRSQQAFGLVLPAWQRASNGMLTKSSEAMGDGNLGNGNWAGDRTNGWMRGGRRRS